MKKLWDLGMTIYRKYEEGINYLIFGFLAFVVNYVAYAACTRVLSLDYMTSTVISWVVAVSFAYFTNRTFVFKSKVKDRAGIIKEVTTFVTARIATGVLELILMFLFVDMIDMNDLIAKGICQFIVILSNYIFSKLFIFKK
ncbi:MAG: GtrA family protein [Lachnospiraceae bacterium]